MNPDAEVQGRGTTCAVIVTGQMLIDSIEKHRKIGI